MASRAKGDPPSPDHYWNKATGRWTLRRGVRKMTPADRLLHDIELSIAAKARPRTARKARGTGKPPSAQALMTQDQVRCMVHEVLTGEVLPPPAREAADLDERTVATWAGAERVLGAAGLEHVVGLIEDGWSYREIAARLGVRVTHLNRWLRSTPEAERRVREARGAAAQAWLDRGLEAISSATDVMELAKAREVASLCRRYAAIYNPAFSDRVQVDTTVRTATPEEVDARLRSLVAEVAQAALPAPDDASE